jgi:Adenylylsulphate kinase
MIQPHGGFILVHLATSLEVCEKRNRKGLYAKARAALVKQFTGTQIPTKRRKVLVEAAGGFDRSLNGSELRFNNPLPLLSGLLACSPQLDLKLNSWLRERTEHSERG